MNVLFVCNGNVARSQEAEAYFTSQTPDGVHRAASAGINVKLGKPIDPMVVAVMKEDGYDLAGAVRKQIDPEMVRQADRIVSFKPANEAARLRQ